MTFLKNFIHDEEGQDLVEYALLLGFVALSATAILLTLGGNVKTLFTNANTQMGSVPKGT